MKKLLFILLTFAAIGNTYGQDSTATSSDTSYWHKGTTLALSMSQSSLTNWNGGGQNAIALNGLSNSFLNYEKGKVIFSNALTMSFGTANQANRGWRKTDDRLYYNGKLSYKKSEKLRYTVYVDFLTQFADGFNYVQSGANPSQDSAVLVSKFMSRATSTFALGAEYTPVKGLYIFFSPVTMKSTFVGYQPFANAGAFGVLPEHFDKNTGDRVAGSNTLFEPGALMDINYKKDILKNIALQTKLSLFWAYMRKNHDIDAAGVLQSNEYEFYKNVDVMWDMSIVMKVTKYITASVTTSLIYDDDIDVLKTKYINDQTNPKAYGPAIQFKQVIGLGLQANFKSKYSR